MESTPGEYYLYVTGCINMESTPCEYYLYVTGCINMESTPGEYYFISDGEAAVCGLYMIGDTDTLVEIEFEEFNIGCESGGLLAVSVPIHNDLNH